MEFNMKKTINLEQDNLINGRAFNSFLMKNSPSLPHTHNFFEICYIIDGEINEEINNCPSRLLTNQLTILRPNIDLHAYSLHEEKDCIYRNILISTQLFQDTCQHLFNSNDFFTAIINKPDPPVITLSTEDVTFLETLLSLLTKDNTEKDEDYIGKSVTATILAFYTKHLEVLVSSTSPAWLKDLCSFLQTPINFNKSLASIISEHFYFNQAYICKAFKKKFGITMTEYFLQAKLNYAKRLLISSNYNIEQIAEKSGFMNLSYFNRVFKKHFHTTPSLYRNMF